MLAINEHGIERNRALMGYRRGLSAILAITLGATLFVATPSVASAAVPTNITTYFTSITDPDGLGITVSISELQLGQACEDQAIVSSTGRSTTLGGEELTALLDTGLWTSINNGANQIERTQTFATVGAGQSCPNITSQGFGVRASTGKTVGHYVSFSALPSWATDFLADVGYFAVSLGISTAIMLGTAYINPALAVQPWYETAVGCLSGAAGNAVYLLVLGQSNWKDALSGSIAGCLTTAAELVAFSRIGKYLSARLAASAAPTEGVELFANGVLSRSSSNSSIDTVFFDALSDVGSA